MNDDDVIILPPARGAGRQGGRFPWRATLAIGAVLVAVGAVLLISPFVAATWLLSLLLGLSLALMGAGIISRNAQGSLVAGLALVAAGVLAMVFSTFTATVVVGFFGIAFIALGVLGLLIAAAAGSGPTAVTGAITIGIGVIAIAWPQFALTVLALLLGVVSIALGAWLIGFAIRLRKSGADITMLRA